MAMMDIQEQEMSGVLQFANMDEIEIETKVQEGVKRRLDEIIRKREELEKAIEREKAVVVRQMKTAILIKICLLTKMT